jgi:HEPN domain-containing protein
MSNRYSDWFRQAEADLRHARNALEDGDFEWSCFRCSPSCRESVKSCLSQARYGCLGAHADCADRQPSYIH